MEILKIYFPTPIANLIDLYSKYLYFKDLINGAKIEVSKYNRELDALSKKLDKVMSNFDVYDKYSLEEVYHENQENLKYLMGDESKLLFSIYEIDALNSRLNLLMCEIQSDSDYINKKRLGKLDLIREAKKMGKICLKRYYGLLYPKI